MINTYDFKNTKKSSGTDNEVTKVNNNLKVNICIKGESFRVAASKN